MAFRCPRKEEVGKIHAKAMGTQSAIEALSAHKGQFILINPHMNAICAKMARHPHFQADTFATQEEATTERRELVIGSPLCREYEVREIMDAFIEEFRSIRDGKTMPQGPNFR